MSTLLTTLNGRLQWQCTQKPDPAKERTWKFWNGMTSKLSEAMGLLWSSPTNYVTHLID